MMAEGYGISSWRDESVLGLNGGNSHTDLNILTTELYKLKWWILLCELYLNFKKKKNIKEQID